MEQQKFLLSPKRPINIKPAPSSPGKPKPEFDLNTETRIDYTTEGETNQSSVQRGDQNEKEEGQKAREKDKSTNPPEAIWENDADRINSQTKDFVRQIICVR